MEYSKNSSAEKYLLDHMQISEKCFNKLYGCNLHCMGANTSVPTKYAMYSLSKPRECSCNIFRFNCTVHYCSPLPHKARAHDCIMVMATAITMMCS